MDVKLAGFNVNVDVLNELTEQAKNRTLSSEALENLIVALTPEVNSAAYARISRSEKNVGELRAEAAANVPKARKSNQNIVFEMSHHSIAEHAYLNFDIVNLSRLAVEALESHRLASFTEKSQRYVTFKGDYFTPNDFSTEEQDKFHALVQEQNAFYERAIPLLVERQARVNFNKDAKTREGLAKEDARYGISLATQTQLGLSVNARELEYMIRKFKHHPLSEVRELGQKLYAEAHQLVPSLIQFADGSVDDSFMREYRKDVAAAVEELLSDCKGKDHLHNAKRFSGSRCDLLNYSANADEAIIGGMVSQQTGIPNHMTKGLLSKISAEDKQKFMLSCLQHLNKYDTLPREFELADFTFEVIVSAGAYGQLKRHRMATVIPYAYNPNMNCGYVTPISVQETGLKPELEVVINKSNELYNLIRTNHPENTELADYCLTNAHVRRVLVNMNLRDLYHFSRLREDGHAQWEIRELAHSMIDKVRKVAPIAGMLLGGKDQFDEVRGEQYGR